MGEERRKERDRGTEGMKNRTENRRRKKNWERATNPATKDHSVTSYDAQGSYGETTLFTSPAHRKDD